jgi:diguanylate cyclase (GGDEF)-like protein
MLNRVRDRMGRGLRRHSFAFRLILGLTLSMALLVAGSQVFFTQVMTDQLIDQGSRFYAAEAVAIGKAYDEGDSPDDALDDALDLTESIRDRPDVVDATLFDSDHHAVAVARDGGPVGIEAGEFDPNPRFDQAISDGLSYSGVETSGEEGESRFEFIVPVKLDGQPYVLEVDQDATGLNAQIASLRDQTVLFVSIALVIAMGLFYLVVGRALMRRHGKARKGASRDPLTDLGNHGLFQEELARGVSFATRRNDSVALALIDIDEFKLVNDRFGHKRGDEVLSKVAGILKSGRAEDRAFRIGGDEFALLMPGSTGGQARATLKRCLVKASAGPNPTSLTAGIAVTSPGLDGETTELAEQADAALYEGKRTGGEKVVLFNDVVGSLVVVTPPKVHALRSLLDTPRIDVAFQPIWDLQDNTILGYEALARPWAGYGLDGPAEAFAIAETIGKVNELDAICRGAALGSADELPDDALLFINISPQSLTHSTVEGDKLVHAVRAAGLEPKRVVLEITERSPGRPEHVIAEARRLRRLGFHLALDDVGAGHSGLEMLGELPVDFVKIDRSIVVAAVNDPKSQALLVAIIALARRADAFVIAEGIESEQILSFIRHPQEMNVLDERLIHGGQGFLLGPPDFDFDEPPHRPGETPDELAASAA